MKFSPVYETPANQKIFCNVNNIFAALSQWNSLSFLSLQASTNIQHDGENNFLLKHKYNASSIENSDRFGVYLTSLC